MAGKKDIVDRVHESVDGITKKQAEEAFDTVFDAIAERLEAGDRVQVAGFGSFMLSERKPRTGRNPATGEAMTIAASKSVRMKPGKVLKDRVNR